MKDFDFNKYRALSRRFMELHSRPLRLTFRERLKMRWVLWRMGGMEVWKHESRKRGWKQ